MVLHKASICIIKVVNFVWRQYLNGIPLLESRHMRRVGGAGSFGVIPHRLIPRGLSIICVKLSDEFLALEQSFSNSGVVD